MSNQRHCLYPSLALVTLALTWHLAKRRELRVGRGPKHDGLPPKYVPSRRTTGACPRLTQAQK
jgi:hypothetical protein